MARSIRKRDVRRNQIIEAAIEVFGSSNFQNAGVAEIARKANIAEGTIYQYFKNKEELFFAIPAQMIDEFLEELELHLEGIQDASNKLRKFIWFYLHHFKTNPAYARSLMLEMHVNKNFYRSQTFNRAKGVTDRIVELIKEGQEEGFIDKEMDRHAIHDLLRGILEYRVRRWVLQDTTYDLLENYDEIFDMFFYGIRPGKKTTKTIEKEGSTHTLLN